MTCILDAISYNQKKQFFSIKLTYTVLHSYYNTHTHIYKLSPTTFTTMKIKREPAL